MLLDTKEHASRVRENINFQYTLGVVTIISVYDGYNDFSKIFIRLLRVYAGPRNPGGRVALLDNYFVAVLKLFR